MHAVRHSYLHFNQSTNLKYTVVAVLWLGKLIQRFSGTEFFRLVEGVQAEVYIEMPLF